MVSVIETPFRTALMAGLGGLHRATAGQETAACRAVGVAAVARRTDREETVAPATGLLVSVAWSRLARLMCASSSTSSSNMTITRETIRAATTNSCSDRHLRSTRTPTLSGGSASADFSASTTERPHEGAAHYLHLTPKRLPREHRSTTTAWGLGAYRVPRDASRIPGVEAGTAAGSARQQFRR